jgi:hypothetical protein
MLGLARCGFHKKRVRARYVEHVFLHPVGSVGRVDHFDASEAWNVVTIFFMLGCDKYGFYNKGVWTRYVEFIFLHPVGSAGHIVHSHASGPRAPPPPPPHLDSIFAILDIGNRHLLTAFHRATAAIDGEHYPHPHPASSDSCLTFPVPPWGGREHHRPLSIAAWPSPPVNATASAPLRRPTVALPPRWVPAITSLPGAPPDLPSRLNSQQVHT